MEYSGISQLLEPAPLALETGYERLPDGVLHVAVRTDMRGCTGEMFEWWFRWRCDTQKYIWWHPVDHMFSAWQGDLSDETHVGSEHIVNEWFTGTPAQDAIIQFRDPSEFFDPAAYELARNERRVSAAVLGRIGFSHQPPRQPDGAVIGGRLLHVGRDTEWGLALRSHFFVGLDLPGLGVAADEIERELPDVFGRALLQHAYNEFTFLSRFLPSLFIAEHRDLWTPTVPW